MEKEIFDWIEWDEQDNGCLSFNKITLKQNVGDFKIGTKFDGAYLDFQHGQLQLLNFKDPDCDGFRAVKEYFDFKLKLIVT